ncbi:MAG: YihA family ribosome biogenesis GTP-binding protein [Myxococcales bacterium]|nr:YihA family ribosome biogenesis GTP-binding protein [Myxococcales bacterium]
MRVPVADFERSAAAPTDWPPEEEGLPEVAFCGRSNVGKSSLINFLVDRKGLVRVSRTPGRTRLVNFFQVELLDGETRRRVRLVDLPGFGYAKVSKTERATWRPGIEAYLGKRGALRAVALLVDARRDVEIDERELAPWIAARGVRVIPVITKADKLSKHERPLAADKLRRTLGSAPVLVSATEGFGREELWRRLLAALPFDVARHAP